MTKDKDTFNDQIHSLDKSINKSSSNPENVLVIANAGIKNNVATLILHICSCCNILVKTLHHATNVTSTEAELFLIRCSINQAVQVINAKKIIVVIDGIHAARHIFDSSVHPYQLHSIAISQDLRAFFNKDSNNSIAFWDCPSSAK